MTTWNSLINTVVMISYLLFCPLKLLNYSRRIKGYPEG